MWCDFSCVDAHTWRALEQVPVSAPLPPAPVAAQSAPWMKIALGELGVHEYGKIGRHNARIVEYHGETSLKATADETPWCSAFVNWAMVQAGFKGTNSALAASWLNRKGGIRLKDDRYGAVTVIKRTNEHRERQGDRLEHRQSCRLLRQSVRFALASAGWKPERLGQVVEFQPAGRRDTRILLAEREVGSRNRSRPVIVARRGA